MRLSKKLKILLSGDSNIKACVAILCIQSGLVIENAFHFFGEFLSKKLTQNNVVKTLALLSEDPGFKYWTDFEYIQRGNSISFPSDNKKIL
jgi:hypothetical protein